MTSESGALTSEQRMELLNHEVARFALEGKGTPAPVAPTTPMRRSGMLALRLGRAEVEGVVQRLHGLLDVVVRDVEGDLDR